LHQPIEIEAVEQLHHVVKRSIVSHSEIVEIHGVRRSKLRRDLRFPLEAAHRPLV